MSTAEKAKANPATEAPSDVTITLSQDVLTALRAQVGFRTVGDVRALVADAINSYVHLGQLRASGAEIFARQGEDGAAVRLHFPFDPAPAAASDTSEG